MRKLIIIAIAATLSACAGFDTCFNCAHAGEVDQTLLQQEPKKTKTVVAKPRQVENTQILSKETMDKFNQWLKEDWYRDDPNRDMWDKNWINKPLKNA